MKHLYTLLLGFAILMAIVLVGCILIKFTIIFKIILFALVCYLVGLFAMDVYDTKPKKVHNPYEKPTMLPPK